MGCSKCNEITTCTCSTTTCGCSTILDTNCVEYTGADLACLAVVKGNKLESILSKINDFACSTNNSLEAIETGQEITIGNTLFVSKLGVDGTGERQNLTKHFLTVTAALAKAKDGDTIVIYPGTYDEGVLTVTDINLSIIAVGDVTLKSNITVSNASGSIVDLNIKGEFLKLLQSNEAVIGINATAAIDLYIECDSIDSGTSVVDFINTVGNLLHLKCDSMTGDNKLVYSEALTFNANINRINHNKITVYAFDVTDAANFDFNVEKFIGTGADAGSLLLTATTCKGKMRVGSSDYLYHKSLHFDESKIKLYDSILLGHTTESFGILSVISSLDNTSYTLVEGCRLESKPSNAETYARNVVVLGEDGLVTDKLEIKFKNTTIINRSTLNDGGNPNLNTGCVGYLGVGGSSNLETWYQNCYLFSASLFYFTPYDVGASVFMGDGATINCIGGNMTNAAKVAVIVDATFTFAGSFTEETGLIKEMLFDIT